MLLNVWKCWKYQKNGKGMWWNVIKCHQKCDQMLDLKCDQMWLKMWENVIECHQMSKNVGKCDWNVRKRLPDMVVGAMVGAALVVGALVGAWVGTRVLGC